MKYILLYSNVISFLVIVHIYFLIPLLILLYFIFFLDHLFPGCLMWNGVFRVLVVLMVVFFLSEGVRSAFSA